MCIIIDNRAGRQISDCVIQQAVTINPDGFGIYYTDTNELFKTLDMNEAARRLAEPRPFIAHCRFATLGKVCEANIHPIQAPDDSLLFQNGTVDGLARSGNDTRQIANIMHTVKKRNVADFLSAFESRFVYIQADGRVTRTGHWIEFDGVFYSKDNVLPFLHDAMPDSDRPHLVAVYGTLKDGLGNHHVLSGAKYLDDCQTVDPYRLCIDGLPFLLRQPHADGYYVNCELYAVSDQTLAALDRLEGHPSFYCRESIQFLTYSGNEVSAMVYLVGEEYDTGVYHDSFHGNERYEAENEWLHGRLY